MNKKKYYPCQVCKGQGGWKDVILDDGSGPFEECNYCKGEGHIEIGGELHKQIVCEKIGMLAIGFLKEEKVYSASEMQAVGQKALDMAKDVGEFDDSPTS